MSRGQLERAVAALELWQSRRAIVLEMVHKRLGGGGGGGGGVASTSTMAAHDEHEPLFVKVWSLLNDNEVRRRCDSIGCRQHGA